MIEFRHVTKTFPNETTALEDVSFHIDPREFVFITGASGAGKTTLGRLLIREFLPTSGEIAVGDYTVTTIKPAEIPTLRQQIGVVFQDFKLLPDRTASENIALSLEILGKSQAEINAQVTKVLELTGLTGKGNLFPSELSGGEIQRTVIARAISSEPAVLFADEPTGNLDPETGWAITKLLVDINNIGTTVIMATHNRDIVKEAKKRVISLEKGKVVNDTDPKPISKPQTPPEEPAVKEITDETVSPPEANREEVSIKEQEITSTPNQEAADQQPKKSTGKHPKSAKKDKGD